MNSIPLDLLRLRPGCSNECPACRHRQWPLAAILAQKQDFLARTVGPWAAQTHHVEVLALLERDLG